MERAGLQARQVREKEFWRTSPHERPGSTSLQNLINKAGDAGILLDVLQLFHADFARARDILELGGGQGWASCIVKGMFPSARVSVTDLSCHALASLPKWEQTFEIKVDGAYACLSYQVPVRDESYDLVFCFAAAHHFGAHRRTLQELSRIIRPNGMALYLYEPSCPAGLHRMALARVEKKRPEVPEDVLVYSKLQRIATEVGLHAEVRFYPSVRYRSPAALLYYAVLGRISMLQRLLPCTANYRFTKAV